MILLMYGEDSFGSWRKLKIIKERFFASQDRNNFHEVSGESLDATDLPSLLLSQSLWQGHRLIVFRDALSSGSVSAQNQLLEIIKQMSDPSLTVVFWETQKFDKRCQLFKFLNLPKLSEEFVLPSPNQLTSHILQIAKEADVRLTPTQVARITDITGSDLWGIYNEIQKIASAPSAELIEQLFSPTTSFTAFALQDAISKSDSKSAQHTVRLQLENGEEPYLLLGSLASVLRNIVRICDLSEKGAPHASIAQTTKLHPFVVTKLQPVAKRHPLSYWTSLLCDLSDLDWKSKTGVTNIGDSLELISLKTT